MQVLKLYVKDLWHVTEDIPKENLIVFRDDNGVIKHFSIPLEDLGDWSIEDE